MSDVQCDVCRRELRWLDVYLYNPEPGSEDMRLCESCWIAEMEVGAAQEQKKEKEAGGE